MTEESNMVRDVEHIGSLKERLQHVANEIDTVKDSFSKSTEELTKIKSMLDIGSLDEISGIIESFEGRLSEIDKQREDASHGAKKYSEELEKEKERLIKLWDAYKNQEEELSTTEKKLSEYEERTRVAESSKKQLEDDLTNRINTLTQKINEDEEKVKQFDEYKQRCDEFDGIRNRLEGGLNSLKNEINVKDDTIATLQKQAGEWKDKESYEEYKTKFEEVTRQYEKEKERLTKLYQLYEETENEYKRLRGEVKGWQDWFDSNKEIFDRLFSGAPPSTPTTEPPKEMPVEPVTPSEEPVEEKPSEPKAKRKKLRFKK